MRVSGLIVSKNCVFEEIKKVTHVKVSSTLIASSTRELRKVLLH